MRWQRVLPAALLMRDETEAPEVDLGELAGLARGHPYGDSGPLREAAVLDGEAVQRAVRNVNSLPAQQLVDHSLVLRYVYADSLAMAAVPQLVVLERTLRVGEGVDRYLEMSPERVIHRAVGMLDIASWLKGRVANQQPQAR